MAALPGPETRLRAMLNDMFRLLPVPLFLFVAREWAVALPQAAVVGLVGAMAVLMAAGIWLRAVVRRRIFLAGALRPESVGHRWLRGGAGLALVAVAKGVVLAGVLLVAVVRQPGPLLLAMVLSVPLLVLLWHGVFQLLKRHAVPRFRAVLALRFALVINFVLLFGGLAVAAVFLAYPDFTGVSLSDAVLSEVAGQHASSALLQVLLQAAAAVDAVGWWLGQQVLPGVTRPSLQFLGWALLLATDALAVWSYLVFCSSVLALAHWRDWHPGVGR
ncbi:hypothetical protein TVNIR_1284 [Thioalkalivibrio nitratireducens DSM 14787]|uniref:Transmembrane protein n=1 Tax=Thioalkalivibrio nitratireducens (strain DSM 14787 / UNIQEM 213 / ALEN2) TaxID=1255043 RepID=L0DVC4_THIND|nr:hypothetical protein [Thioalkalivibrio nitratireducens]AGA32957.1 hypothetical protein TVNIR_1284 [Thioalkalivibrio nitratireducens DSM 14787]